MELRVLPKFNFLNCVIVIICHMMLPRFSPADDAPRTTTRLGRVRASCMSPETKLSFFLQNVKNAHVTWKSDSPIKKWFNVHADTESMIRLEWMSLNLSGNITWAFLPENVVSLKLQSNKLEGPIDTSVLPPVLSVLWLNDNLFSGGIDLTTLPTGLTQLCLNRNELSGTLNLQHLPPKLSWLSLNINHFSGTVSLKGLPTSLKEFYLADNDLKGTINVRELPARLRVIRLRGRNKFEVVGAHHSYDGR